MSRKLVLVAAAALFDADGRVLLAQRPEGKSMAGLWEFPGGKLEANESPEAALVRELSEELGIKTRLEDLRPLNFTSYSYPDFHLLMPLYSCREWSGNLVPQEGQNISWVKIADLKRYKAPAADIPLFDYLISGEDQGPT